LWAQITRDYGELIELQVYQEKLEQEIAKRWYNVLNGLYKLHELENEKGF